MVTLLREPIPSHPKLVFMGTPEFAVPTLKALIDHKHDIRALVTQPDRPKGRGRKMTAPPVKHVALENGIPVLQPLDISDERFHQVLRNMRPDLILVIAFGMILKKELLELPWWGAVNIHASLLPKYRGAAPIQWAILSEESWTGLTVMRMEEGLDTGPILFQNAIPILEEETAGHIHDRLSQEAGDLMIRSLKQMSEGPVKEIPQDNDSATYAPKIAKTMALIDWKLPARKISALIRGLDPWPGAYTTFHEWEIKLFLPRVVDDKHLHGTPGRVVRENEGLWVETGAGLIEIREIQFPGKKRMHVTAFLRGFPLPDGTILGV